MSRKRNRIIAILWGIILLPVSCGLGCIILRIIPEGQQCGLYQPYPGLFPDMVQEVCISTGMPWWAILVVFILVVSLPIIIADRIYVSRERKRKYSDFRCPICESNTILRTAKKGPDAGKDFHICTKYPECKGRIREDYEQ
jgi:predicted RNA-binding Zn-ribbon protein involved in translation (DUF1610 family)